MRRRGSDGLEGHLDGVRMLGEELARRHGISPARLAMAAHMHDWFRRVPPRKLKAILGKLGVRLDAETSRHPALWHGIVASECARRNAGISDRDILAAVRWHTTGHPVSTRLGRALFVADFCERNRGFREAAGASRPGTLRPRPAT